MRSSKMWRYYSSLVERKVKRIRRTKRQLMAVGVGCLVLGLILGTVFGGMRQKKKTEKRTKETIAEVRKEERQKRKKFKESWSGYIRNMRRKKKNCRGIWCW